MHHYDPVVVADQATGRPLTGVRATVIDAETLAPVQTYREGQPAPLVTGAHGVIAEFQTEETTRRVQLTAGPVRLTRWCQETVGAAQDGADRAEAAAGEAADATSQAAAIRDGLEPRMRAVEAAVSTDPGSVTDGQVASVVAQLDTQTRASVNAAIRRRMDTDRRVFVVEDFAQDGDAHDTFAWQRAVDALVAAGGRGTVQGTRTEYRFGAPVSIDGLTSATLTGLGKYQTTIRGTGSGPSIIAAFHAKAGAGQRDIEAVTVRDMTLDGDMTSVHVGHARDRTFAPGNVKSLLHVSGDRVPTETANRRVQGVYVERVRLRGVQSLPVHVRGADTVSLIDCETFRCLDPGWIHCRVVHVSGLVSEWSADNGVSLSRGCEDGTVTGCTITGAFFAGIHVAGFGGEAGPRRVTVSGNVVVNSACYGISLEYGTSRAVVTGNVVDGVRRGAPGTSWESDSNGVRYGSGILVHGDFKTVPTQDPEDVTHWAKDVLVTGNLVRGAERWGIVYYACDGLTITANHVSDVGVATMLDGSAIVADNVLRSIGIGAFAPASSTVRNTRVYGNAIQDTRSTPVMNFGIWDPASEAAGAVATNRATGARTWTPSRLTGDVLHLGTSSGTTNAEVRLDSAPGEAEQIISFLSGGTAAWSIRKTKAGDLAIRDKTGATLVAVYSDGSVRTGTLTGKQGFFGRTPRAKPSVTGARGGNAALASLVQALAELGLIDNQTTAS